MSDIGTGNQEMEVVVLVKAAPVLTRDLEETMCVAGARVDGEAPEWVRLHPVPFRDLDEERRFAKYQRVTLSARRSRTDRRPESWSPVPNSLTLHETMATGDSWASRRHLVDQLPEESMCELIEANRSGSGPGTQSLAVVRPIEPPVLEISSRDADQLEEWNRRAAGVAARASLFDAVEGRKPDFEVVPWRFRYGFRCVAPNCPTHHQTIVDWEVLALWRHVRRRSNWQELMRQKFETELWAGRDTVLFVGNQEQRPISFLVLGVFWPPDVPAQGVLL
jgi:hypothetical protein